MTVLSDCPLTRGLPRPTSTLSEPLAKKHAACDECRTSKLKCSGEPTGCSRCIKMNLWCRYSIQKPMGRPPKKRLREDDALEFTSLADGDMWNPDSGSHATGAVDALPFSPLLYSDHFGGLPDLLVAPGDIGHLSNQPAGTINATASLTRASPDLWTVPAFTSVPSSSMRMPNMPIDSLGLFAAPIETQCSCLSCLYLCLSNLSTLSSLPASRDTLESLLSAAKTAQQVIRCGICPKTFPAAMPNVMLTGTLLTVLTHSWLRIFNTEPEAFYDSAAVPSYVTDARQSSQDNVLDAKTKLHQTVRCAVFGIDTPSLSRVDTQWDGTPSLLSLIEEIEARQRRWHAGNTAGYPLQQHDSMNLSKVNDSDNGIALNQADPKLRCAEHDFLCLRVVGCARMVLSKFHLEQYEGLENET